jgi:hypothetical protein
MKIPINSSESVDSFSELAKSTSEQFDALKIKSGFEPPKSENSNTEHVRSSYVSDKNSIVSSGDFKTFNGLGKFISGLGWLVVGICAIAYLNSLKDLIETISIMIRNGVLDPFAVISLLTI